MAAPLKPKDAPDLSRFGWEDPFRLNDQLSEDERMMRDSARAYAQERLQPRVIAAYREEKTDPAIFREMGEMGLLGVTIPEEYGGLGASYVSYGLVAREVERLNDAESGDDGNAHLPATPGAHPPLPEGDRTPIALMSGSGATVFLLTPLAGVAVGLEVSAPASRWTRAARASSSSCGARMATRATRARSWPRSPTRLASRRPTARRSPSWAWSTRLSWSAAPTRPSST